MRNRERNVFLGSMDSGKMIEWEPWHLHPDYMRVFVVTDFRFDSLITCFVYPIRCAWWSMDYWASRKTAMRLDKWYLSAADASRAALECYYRPDDWHPPFSNLSKDLDRERDAVVAAVVLDSIAPRFIRPRGF